MCCLLYELQRPLGSIDPAALPVTANPGGSGWAGFGKHNILKSPPTCDNLSGAPYTADCGSNELCTNVKPFIGNSYSYPIGDCKNFMATTFADYYNSYYNGYTGAYPNTASPPAVTKWEQGVGIETIGPFPFVPGTCDRVTWTDPVCGPALQPLALFHALSCSVLSLSLFPVFEPRMGGLVARSPTENLGSTTLDEPARLLLFIERPRREADLLPAAHRTPCATPPPTPSARRLLGMQQIMEDSRILAASATREPLRVQASLSPQTPVQRSMT